ncbi:endo-1,4-beta-xylanase [Aurantiacibacter sp. MUD61]|uniref:endo-1,4-beta-xylanase n=1 Tax=Aurantiacibacter sp. MUD61 TaxID=3009083 RepID=UPI0022F09D73|nr:endo-1,4-beta-xylanase [Aurantiacibacter sp. MUD61]
MLNRRQFMGRSAALGALAASPASGLAQSDNFVSLDAIARSKGLRFGTATDGSEVNDAEISALIRRECSVLVSENAHKWKHLKPREAVFRSEEAETITEFADANDMEMRGHCFIWNQDNRIPEWIHAQEEELGANGGEALIRHLWNYAEELVTTFPTIQSWDAVNEVITPWEGDIRNSALTRIFGEQVMDVGFGIMRAKAPEAQLVYNDYMDWKARPNHRDGVLALLERALSRDVPIDALGIQAHLGGNVGNPIDEAGWVQFLTEIRDLGLQVLITELDCSDRFVESSDPAVRDATTAAQVKDFLDVTLSFTNVERVVLWSISDRGSYLRRPQYPEERRRPDGLPMRGHPYDEDLQPTAMRDAIALALGHAPER